MTHLAGAVRHVPKNIRGKRKEEEEGIVRGSGEREEEASRRIDTAMIVGGVDPHLRSLYVRPENRHRVSDERTGVLPRRGSGRSRKIV